MPPEATITISNVNVGTNPERILAACGNVMATEDFTCPVPEKWDGHAADRIADVLTGSLATR